MSDVKTHRVRRTVGGLCSGLLFGLGLVLMLVMYGTVALGTRAPFAVLAGALLVGLAVGLLPRRR